MVDRLTQRHRSWNMSRIGGRDTGPERLVRSMVHRLGLRFRLHRRDLPGRPDIVLVRRGTVIFVHGCFWHRHPKCKYAYTPKSRIDFWLAKFHGNIRRDLATTAALRRMGWRVVVVWECETFAPTKLSRRLKRLLAPLTYSL